MNATEPVVGM